MRSVILSQWRECSYTQTIILTTTVHFSMIS